MLASSAEVQVKMKKDGASIVLVTKNSWPKFLRDIESAYVLV